MIHIYELWKRESACTLQSIERRIQLRTKQRSKEEALRELKRRGEWGEWGSGRSELEIDKILRVVAVAVRAEKEHDGDQDEIDGVAQDEGVVQFLREFPVVDKPVGGKQGENA